MLSLERVSNHSLNCCDSANGVDWVTVFCCYDVCALIDIRTCLWKIKRSSETNHFLGFSVESDTGQKLRPCILIFTSCTALSSLKEFGWLHTSLLYSVWRTVWRKQPFHRAGGEEAPVVQFTRHVYRLRLKAARLRFLKWKGLSRICWSALEQRAVMCILLNERDTFSHECSKLWLIWRILWFILYVRCKVYF